MKTTCLLFALLGIMLLVAPCPADAVDDHLRCYRIKDPLKLKGIVDIDSPQFGLAPGCTISKAKLFCVPADKTSADVEVGGLPFLPLPLTAPPAPGDRVCYKVKCTDAKPALANITDQFGNRSVEKFKDEFLCTPAVKGTAYCGDGVVNGAETCDPPNDSACPGQCEPGCGCPGCPTPSCASLGMIAGVQCHCPEIPLGIGSVCVLVSSDCNVMPGCIPTFFPCCFNP